MTHPSETPEHDPRRSTRSGLMKILKAFALGATFGAGLVIGTEINQGAKTVKDRVNAGIAASKNPHRMTPPEFVDAQKQLPDLDQHAVTLDEEHHDQVVKKNSKKPKGRRS